VVWAIEVGAASSVEHRAELHCSFGRARINSSAAPPRQGGQRTGRQHTTNSIVHPRRGASVDMICTDPTRPWRLQLDSMYPVQLRRLMLIHEARYGFAHTPLPNIDASAMQCPERRSVTDRNNGSTGQPLA
jgi:hypothetical protein